MLRSKRESLSEALSAPTKKRKQRPDSSQAGPDERFYCPFPGCKRSFAELWRLKVHYRAPPDVRGSGKERGHGSELGICPKCGRALFTGKHHVNCLPLARSQSFESFESREAQAQKRARPDHPSAFARASGSDSGQSVQTGQVQTCLDPNRSLSDEGCLGPSRNARRSAAQGSFPSSYEGSVTAPISARSLNSTRGVSQSPGYHWPLTEELIARAKAACDNSQVLQAASCDLLATLAQPAAELTSCPAELFCTATASALSSEPPEVPGSVSRDSNPQPNPVHTGRSFPAEPVADRLLSSSQPMLSHKREPEASFLPRCLTPLQWQSWAPPLQGQFPAAFCDMQPESVSRDLSFCSTIDTGVSSSLDPGTSCSLDPAAWLSMPTLDQLGFPPADPTDYGEPDYLFDLNAKQEACSTAWPQAMLDVFSTPVLPDVDQHWFIKQEEQTS